MPADIRIFLKKFLAALYLKKVTVIPFSDERFQEGIQAVEAYLKKDLDPNLFNKLSDMFVKTPVQETYNQIRDMLMDLNGDSIKFSALENPYWTDLTIAIDNRYATYLLDDNSYLNIERSIIENSADKFIEKIGVNQWEMSLML